MRKAIFPGTFDPVHFGHMSVLHTAARLFDSVLWCVAVNPTKQCMYSVNDRLAMMDVLNQEMSANITICSTSEFIVDLCRRHKIDYIIRSFRMTADFEYEMQLAMINAKLAPLVTTVFLPCTQDCMHISSTAVREFIKAGRIADLAECVPPILLDKGFIKC